MSYDKVNYLDILEKKGYKDVEDVRTFDGKTLHVSFRNENEEKIIKI